MNSLSDFSRWNRFRLLKAKTGTPEPSAAKTGPKLAPKQGNKSLSGHPGLTPEGRRGKEALTLTIKHQNRCPSHQQSSSLSTKYKLPRYHLRDRTNHSKNKTGEENSLSLQRFISGGRRGQKKHKINYSILQRIRRTLGLYPNIAHEFKQRGQKVITFATQSEEQGRQSPESDAINLQKLVLWRESKVIKTTERIYEHLMQIEVRESEASPKKRNNSERISIQAEMKRYLMHRYKTEKLCKQNFVNLLYSLYYYSDKFQYEHSLAPKTARLTRKLRTLSIFQKFVSLEYNQDDLIFYLYSRNIFSEILGRESRSDEASFVTGEQVRRFLDVLANGDACIVRYYEQYLMRAAVREEKGLEVNEVLYLLLTNFQEKKARTALRPEIGKEVQFEEREITERTTRSQTLSCSRLNMAVDRSFWRTSPPPEEAIPDTLYEKLLSEIGSQTKKLMSYFHLSGGAAREATAELILIKAIRMLNAVHRMDKYVWFEEMQLVREKVLVACGEDFAQVEALQQEIKAIEEDERAGRLQRRRVLEFAKRLLTVKAFVNRLEELFEAVENYCLEEQ